MVPHVAHSTRREKAQMAHGRKTAAVAGRRRATAQSTRGDGSKTYFEVVRSLSADPAVRKAVDETEKTTREKQAD